MAYERLRKARARPDESFSQVIKRASWVQAQSNGAALLRALESAPALIPRVLDRLERAQAEDLPAEDAWSD